MQRWRLEWGIAARRGGLVVGLVLVAALSIPFAWPWLSAWRIYPAPPPDLFLAAVQARAAEPHRITGFDASGRSHQVPAAALTGATPDRCTRWDQHDDRRRGGRHSLPFAGGMAEFACLAGIVAARQPALSAVVLLRPHTRPDADAPPVADILPDGPSARRLLAEVRG